MVQGEGQHDHSRKAQDRIELWTVVPAMMKESELQVLVFLCHSLLLCNSGFNPQKLT